MAKNGNVAEYNNFGHNWSLVINELVYGMHHTHGIGRRPGIIDSMSSYI